MSNLLINERGLILPFDNHPQKLSVEMFKALYNQMRELYKFQVNVHEYYEQTAPRVFTYAL